MTVNINDAGKRKMQLWQKKCNPETSGTWMAKLLPDIIRWMERNFGEVNYSLSQLLSGYDYFCKDLFKMGKMTRSNCFYDASFNDAEHAYFHCER